jgi:aldose 1-epimerase
MPIAFWKLALASLALAAHTGTTQEPTPDGTRAINDGYTVTTLSTTAPRVTKAPFGRLPDGTNVDGYTITNSRGTTLHVITYGGIITSLRTADRAGAVEDIVLGFDSLAGYLKDSPYFGAIVGRYANRIAKGRFTLDGKTYQLPVNNGQNSLHGGTRGLDKVVWDAQQFEHAHSAGVVLTHVSPNGDQGYPGRLSLRVTYTLDDDNRLTIDYHATTDKATPINISQHSYFNLTGGAKRGILAHVLQLDASRYTPVDSTLIPTGALPSVAGTPFDFRKPTAIGARIGEPNEQLKIAGGYDHNWVLDRKGTGQTRAAHVVEPTSGRTLDVTTDQPGVQFYSGNFLDGTITGKGGRVYGHRFGFCLETQHFPDSPNHPSCPSTILKPGQQFNSRTVFTFGVDKGK